MMFHYILLIHDGVMQGPFLAGYEPVQSEPVTYGIQRLDHAVGNVHDLLETVNYVVRATGFHEFAEFTAEVSCSAGVPFMLRRMLLGPVHLVICQTPML
jgi:hypothetical protein